MNLKIFKTKCGPTEKIFVSILGIFLLLSILNATFSTTSLSVTIIAYSILTITLFILFYTSYLDFKTMEIDNWVSLSLILLLLTVNLFLYFFLNPEVGLVISDKFSYVPYDNFLLALVLALIFLLIVVVSKEKAMGAGDIRIALIVGLLIGYNNVIVWLYITVFTALIYGLLLGYKKKNFKKLKIPFAPFMILGAIVSLLVDMYI